MKKYLFYMMSGQKMCAVHALLNALDLSAAGHEVAIILEGESVKLPEIFELENNPIFKKTRDAGLLKGACRACSVMLASLTYNESAGIPIIDDMKGHAGMRAYTDKGYEVIVL